MNSISDTRAKRKKSWERAEFWFEIASVVGGFCVVVGLWLEGETTLGQKLVIFGVALEVACAWWVLVASRKLQNILETEFEELRLQTAEANLEVARLNLELEQLKAPRVLSNERRDELVAKLKAGPKEQVEVIALLNHGEVTRLRDQLVAFLRAAGWTAFPNMNARVPASAVTDGIIVEIYPGTSEHTRHTAIELVAALNSVSLQTVGPVASHNLIGNGRIEILVGNKPSG